MLPDGWEVDPYFYPRPPRGGRRAGIAPCGHCSEYFYPRPPRGGRLDVLVVLKVIAKFLSTPSARRATSSRDFLYSSMSISIHALREEGDPECLLSGCAEKNFYPRPPRGGRRPSFSSPRIRKRFLSTPSARRATELRRQHRLPTPNFYPRPPRGGRRRNPAPQPREAHFYPRPPRGGRPQATPSASDRLISIHALREEGDIAPRVFKPSAASISIHALREEGDPLPRLVAVSIKISIHALREEGDPLYPACGSRSSKISDRKSVV